MISGMLSLLRYWIPSWKFFVEVGPVPTLSYRLSESRVRENTNDFGPWIPCLEKQERHWRTLFLNPQGNLQLAVGNLLDRLVRDVSDLADEPIENAQEILARSVTYQLVVNLVRQRIHGSHGSKEGHFQFKIDLSSPYSSDRTSDEVLVSLPHEV